jgi:TolB-like protein
MKQYRLNALNVSILAVALIFFFIFASHAVAYEKEIKSLSSALSDNISKAGKKNIAVVDFTDLDGNVTKLGRFIAEEFSVALLGSSQGFEVVDRTHLKTLLQEHKLSATGLLDPATARKLGQIAGVEALITGTITSFGESVRLSVKILDANTAKLIGANTSDIPKTKAVEELLAQGIDLGDSVKNVSDTPASISKSIGKQVNFTNKIITKGVKGENEFIKFSVQSLTILQDGRIKLDVTWENINQDKLPIEIKLINPQNNLYLIDDVGHEYTYIESEGATEHKITIRPGAKKTASFIFSQIQLGANLVTLYIDFWGQREGKNDYTDRFIIEGLSLK